MSERCPNKYVAAAFQFYDLSLNPVVSEEEDVLIGDGNSEDSNEDACTYEISAPGTSGDVEQVRGKVFICRKLTE